VLFKGEIAGFITCDIDLNKKIGTICNNAIDPDYQGKGLGKMMYNFILDVFRMEGMEAAAVATMDEDAYLPARKAYEKAGFKRRLKRLTYYMEL
jgi:ribosomal protein S18 acetylase RimI-like enzyme